MPRIMGEDRPRGHRVYAYRRRGAARRRKFSRAIRAGDRLETISVCGLFFPAASAQSDFPVPPALHVTPSAARLFLRRTLGLAEPHADVGAALAHHGYIQIDPINVCGRMHDLILRNRVRGYREGALHAFLHSPARPGFEHYLPGHGILVALPVDAWPFLTARMQRRRRSRGTHDGKLTAREAALAERILAEIAARGPLGSDDFEHDGRARSPWGTGGTLVKRVLEKLFAHGRLLIAARKNFRRVYDLPERVLPPAVLAQPPRSEREVAAWAVRAKLRQRRLALLKRDELRAAEDFAQPVIIDGLDLPPLFCLCEDAPRFDPIQNQESNLENSSAPLLLAPLDPLIYDRRVTRALWDFDYTWEVYTPPAKRVRGYYALPLLAGTEIVGHVDPLADRAKKKLRVVSRRLRRGFRSAPVVSALAEFLGLRA
jgi:uncharacterized protein YcaQ